MEETHRQPNESLFNIDESVSFGDKSDLEDTLPIKKMSKCPWISYCVEPFIPGFGPDNLGDLPTCKHKIFDKLQSTKWSKFSYAYTSSSYFNCRHLLLAKSYYSFSAYEKC